MTHWLNLKEIHFLTLLIFAVHTKIVKNFLENKVFSWRVNKATENKKIQVFGNSEQLKLLQATALGIVGAAKPLPIGNEVRKHGTPKNPTPRKRGNAQNPIFNNPYFFCLYLSQPSDSSHHRWEKNPRRLHLRWCAFRWSFPGLRCCLPANASG